jgi:carbon-monoxide dehydrogenase medium subunit
MSRVLPVDFEYLEPRTLPEAVALLQQYGEEAKPMAGGTDLLVDMKRGKIKPRYLVSLMKIPELKSISQERDGLRIGAAVTFQEICESRLIRERYPLLLEAAQMMGSTQIKNMATVGGNICNALPSADFPPALVALDAEVKIAGKKGERVLPLGEFLVDVRRVKLGDGELLAEVRVRTTPPRSGTAFLKLSRTAEDLATLNVAVRLTLASDGTCEEARVVVGGGVGPTLIRSRKAESLLEGKKLDEALIEEAARVVSEELKPRPTSIRASPSYKMEVSKVLVKRALMRALSTAGEGGAT